MTERGEGGGGAWAGTGPGSRGGGGGGGDDDDARRMRGVLARASAFSATGEDGGAAAAAEDAVGDDELAELADALLALEDEGGGGGGDAVGELVRSLPPHVREAFEAAARGGELSHLVAGDPWRPWWEPDLVRGAGGPGGGGGGGGIIGGGGPTLDERILAVRSVHRRAATATAAAAADLRYGTIDVVFGTALALRLFNGEPLARGGGGGGGALVVLDARADADAAAGAADALLSASAVLGRDGRPGSVGEVLSACAEGAASLAAAGACPVPWPVLASDVTAILAGGRRAVLRALLDGRDLLREGGRAAARTAGTGTGTGGSEEAAEARRRYRLARKKCEYYLSWCSEHWEEVAADGGEGDGEDLAGSVAAWIELWGDGGGGGGGGGGTRAEREAEEEGHILRAVADG